MREAFRKLIASNNTRFISIISRVWSGTEGQPPKYSGQQLKDILKIKFPNAEKVEVTDVSGGCGAMFEIFVEDNLFNGVSMVKQHQMITETLKDQIKEMHGLRIHTSVPEKK